MTTYDLAATRPRATALSLTSSAWAWALGFLVLVIWLIPIKSYRLPVALPFNLELYRLVIIVFLFAWMLMAVQGRTQLLAGGLGVPLLLFGAGATLSLLVNHKAISRAGLETQSVKSLSYLLSFLIAFVLVYSTLQSLSDVELVLRAVVLGGVLVAIAGLIEERTRYNVFNHLHPFLPFLQQVHETGQKTRFGRLRVTASAQHPIALGAALVMTVPLSFYVARSAVGRNARLFWIGASLVLCGAALATESRTVLSMIVVMAIVGLYVRRKAVLHFWPVVPVLLVLVHFAAPRTLSGLYHALSPRGGIVAQQQLRAGNVGSGRLADIGPGLRMWEATPVFGQGPGTSPVRGAVVAQAAQGGQIIFDDQYLRELVEGGLIGFIALAWIVWGTVAKTARASRHVAGRTGDLLAAVAVACGGYAIGILTFDALSFVQVTLLFFVVAALGLRAAALAREGEPLEAVA